MIWHSSKGCVGNTKGPAAYKRDCPLAKKPEKFSLKVWLNKLDPAHTARSYLQVSPVDYDLKEHGIISAMFVFLRGLWNKELLASGLKASITCSKLSWSNNTNVTSFWMASGDCIILTAHHSKTQRCVFLGPCHLRSNKCGYAFCIHSDWCRNKGCRKIFAPRWLLCFFYVQTHLFSTATGHRSFKTLVPSCIGPTCTYSKQGLWLAGKTIGIVS